MRLVDRACEFSLDLHHQEANFLQGIEKHLSLAVSDSMLCINSRCVVKHIFPCDSV